MSMTESGMKPQDTTNFLLGGMQKQLEAIALEQATARAAGESFRTEIRDSIRDLKADLGDTNSDVAVLKAKSLPRTPWYVIVGGISGLAGIAIAAITLLKVLNP